MFAVTADQITWVQHPDVVQWVFLSLAGYVVWQFNRNLDANTKRHESHESALSTHSDAIRKHGEKIIFLESTAKKIDAHDKILDKHSDALQEIDHGLVVIQAEYNSMTNEIGKERKG